MLRVASDDISHCRSVSVKGTIRHSAQRRSDFAYNTEREHGMGVLDRFRLDGRVGVVTGGTKGLGQAMATGLAEAGAEVAIVSRHGDQAQAVAAEMAVGDRAECRGYACDVTQADQVDRLVAQVLADFHQIDILINNAGINIAAPSTH